MHLRCVVGSDWITATSWGSENSLYAPRYKCSTLPTMQHPGDKPTPDSETWREARQLGHRHMVKETAEILATTASGVHSRIKRDTRDSLRVSGTVYVLLDPDQSSLVGSSSGQLAELDRDQLELVEPSQDNRKNEISPKDHTPLLEAKDRTIAELKEQVAFLRHQLECKDAILLRMTERIGEVLPASASEAPDSPQTATPGEVRDGSDRVKDTQEKPERPTLPQGYRVVAVASDAWVLVAPRGLRVAGYRGELDLWRAALDAREHQRRE